MFNIKKHAPFLQLLCSSALFQERALLETASSHEEVRYICNCIRNFREMRYPAPDDTIHQVLPDKDDIYTLADPRRSFMKKKKILILQNGECFHDLPLSPILEVIAHLV